MSIENATIGWADKNKTAMLRKLALVLLLSAPAMSGKGQVYFDNLYLHDDQVEGISLGGSVLVSDGYLTWKYKSPTAEAYGNASLLMIDFYGDVISETDLPLIDTIWDIVRNIVSLNDTIFVALSFEQVLTEDTPGDMVLRKLNRNAEVEWKQIYGDTGQLDVPQRVAITADGGFIMVGQVTIETQGNQEADVWLVKTDENGVVEWEQTYGGLNYDSGSDVVQTPDGGYLLLGWTRSYGAGQRDFYLIKTDNLGNEEWYQTYGGAGNEIGSSILQLSDGNYSLTGSGSQGVQQGSGSLGRIYKIAPDGGTIWAKTYIYESNSGNNLHKSLELWNGDLVSVGMTNNTSNAGYLVRTDSLGEVIWQREYDKNESTDLFYSLLATDDGGFLLSGQAVNEETNSQDAWLLKVDSLGCTFPNCIVGVDEEERTVIVDVWPNPTSEVLHLELQQHGMAEIMLYDMAGKLLLQKQTTQLREVIDVSALESGLYLLSVLQEDMKTTVKVMVW
jgi:hypothetical protein